MPQVFLSYRRQDNDHALSIYLWLIKRYGRESVFWDRKDIDAGRDFTEVIADGLDKSAVLIALIGKEWLGVPDDTGQRKIDSPDDWVRREVEGALERALVVLPVLGIQAGMPAADTLPKSLEPFSRLQALSMADMRFYPLLAEKLADVGFQEDRGAAPPAAESRVRLWAGTLLQRQAERLQIRAKELIREGKTERALEELNEGIALMMALLDFVPGEESLEVQLGYIYGAMAQEFEATGNPEMAGRYRDLQLGIFQRVESGDPSAIKGIGEVYAGRGDYQRAIECYRAALRIEPGYQYAWHDLFVAYLRLAERGEIHADEMRAALQKVRETSAGPEPGTQVPGLDLAYLDSLDAHLRHWEQRAREAPKQVGADMATYLERSRQELEAGNYDAAENTLSKMIELMPGLGPAYHARGAVRLVKGDYRGAAADFSAAIQRGIDQPEEWFRLGKARELAGEPQLAEQSLDRAIDAGCAEADAWYWRGRARLDQQNLLAAETDFGEALQRGYDDPEVYFQRGHVRMAQANLDGAAEDFTSAIAQGYTSPLVYYFRAKVGQFQGEHARVLEDCSAAIAGGLHYGEVHQMRAYAAIRLQQLESAEADYAKAVELEPSYPFAFAGRGDLHLARADYESAIECYRSAVRSDVAAKWGHKTRWRYALGLALLLYGQSEDALAAYSEAAAEFNPFETAIAIRELNQWTKERPVDTAVLARVRQVLGMEHVNSAGG